MRHTLLILLAGLLSWGSSARSQVIDVDVAVFGATSGGVAAAVQASRMGKTVALLAVDTHIGGLTTGGLGNTDIGFPTSIGGIAREFYERLGIHYQQPGMMFFFEPKVARQQFDQMLSAAGVTPRLNQRLASVTMNGLRIREITMEDGTVVRARMFIDTTYEGDLMAAAGVTWTLGCESSSTYLESLGGIQPTVGIRQFDVAVDPYVTPGNPASGLLPLVEPGVEGPLGAATPDIQAYNYRLCLTSNPANRRPITPPPGYTEARYELLGRLVQARVAAGQTLSINQFLNVGILPRSKTDVNNEGPISTDFLGANRNYVTGTYAQRAQIALEHLHYVQGIMFYLGNSTRVPQSLRNQIVGYGTCLDEFTETGGWSPQMYIREARRMVSDYVMIQQDCLNTRMPDDPVGLGGYTIDTHSFRRIVKNGRAFNEGEIIRELTEPYRISYRSLFPRVGECENLLVPWSLSASHVAFGSIRMEPVFMILSQSAATAACFGIDGEVPIQQVPYEKVALQLSADRQALYWNTPAPFGVAIDSEETGTATITGTWNTTTSIAGYSGLNYFHDGNTGKGTKSIRFTPNLPASGLYDVYMRYASHPNRASNVPVTITFDGGAAQFQINQRQGNHVWVKVNTSGPLQMSAGTGSNALVETGGTNGFVVVDSMRFAPVYTPTAMVQIVASDPVAGETNPLDTARFAVVRPTDQTSQPWTVNYVVSGSAGAGDFTALPGSVTIPAGLTGATIDLAAIPDLDLEGSEAVTVTLQEGAAFTVGPRSSATATIRDAPAVQIAVVDAVAFEQPATNTARFRISRHPDFSATAWTVTYTVSGTATGGEDYAELPGTVTLASGESEAFIEVAAINDGLSEAPETLTLTLNAGAGFAVGANAFATATLFDLPMIAIVASDASAGEWPVGSIGTVTISREASAADVEWTVPYTLAGTATPGTDYAALSGTVTLAVGQLTAVLTITPAIDNLPEGPETVEVTLGAGVGYALGSTVSATVQIADEPLDAWKLASFTAEQLADPLISADDADPDGDGIKNLAEYALGLLPLVAESSPATTLMGADGHLRMTFYQRRTATDVVILAEGSMNLASWSAAPEVVEEVERVPAGDFDLVTVRLLPSGSPAGFLRVRVIRL